MHANNINQQSENTIQNMKMKSSTPLIMIYDDCGRFPLGIQVKTRIIKFWAKILTGKNTKISYKMYELLL